MKSDFLSLSRSPSLQRTITIVVVFVVWSIFVWRGIDTFGPQSGHTDFNSDGAITVLMANDARRITVFDTYYYGSDRWGAWPLLAARLVNHATGFRWSEVRLHAARSTWLFFGLLILALLSPRVALPVLVIGIVVVCLEYLLRLRLYDLGQPYAWQIPALLLSWLALRRWLETLASPDPARVRAVVYSLIVVFLSLLAILSSPISGPLLCFVIAVESLRLYAQRIAAPGKSFKYGFFAVGLIVMAVVAELLLRANVHRHGLKHYQEDYKTELALDYGYLLTNLKLHLQSLMIFGWWPLIMATVAFVLAAALVVLSPRLRRHWQPDLSDDTTFTIFSCFGISLINFLLVVAIDHVRVSLYDHRYLAPTFFFSSISGLLVIWRLFELTFRKLNVQQYAQPSFVTVFLVILAIAFPPKLDASLYRMRKATAVQLAQKSPNAVLLGGYWETYVFSALQPENMLMPLPLEGHQVRMPWAIKRLQDAEEVIIEYKRTDPGVGPVPPQNLTQHGTSLRLVDPNWYENGQYAFARYVRQ